MLSVLLGIFKISEIGLDLYVTKPISNCCIQKIKKQLCNLKPTRTSKTAWQEQKTLSHPWTSAL